MRKGEVLESLNFCIDTLGLPRGVANPGRGCQANAIVRRGLPGKYDCLDGEVTIGLGLSEYTESPVPPGCTSGARVALAGLTVPSRLDVHWS